MEIITNLLFALGNTGRTVLIVAVWAFVLFSLINFGRKVFGVVSAASENDIAKPHNT
jgi:hypothetical protein